MQEYLEKKFKEIDAEVTLLAKARIILDTMKGHANVGYSEGVNKQHLKYNEIRNEMIGIVSEKNIKKYDKLAEENSKIPNYN